MPWQSKDVDKFKKDLTDEEKEKWAKVANNALKQCLAKKGDKIECEASAVKIANGQFSEDKKRGFSLTLQEAQPTDEYQMILPIGVFYSAWYGEIIITEAFSEALVENWKNKVLGERQPFIDTEHDRGKANGWIADLQAREDGMYAKIDWTDMGKENIEKGYFKYFSADLGEVTNIDTGEPVWPVLLAVALTNTPVMNTMEPAHLSDGKTSAHSDGDKNHIGGELKMTFDEVLQALKELTLSNEQKQQVAKTAEIKMSDPKPEADPKPDTEKLQLTEKVQLQTEQLKLVLDENKALSQELSTRKAADVAKKKGEVIEKALSDGKILPKNKEKWEAMFDKDPDGTEEILTEKGKEIDLSEKGDGSGGGEGGEEELQLSEKEALKNMGYTDTEIEGGKE